MKQDQVKILYDTLVIAFEELFPIGTEFFSIGMDTVLMVSDYEEGAVIAWAFHDAQSLAEGKEAYPTRLTYSYMLDRRKVWPLEDWLALPESKKQEVYAEAIGVSRDVLDRWRQLV